METLAIGAYVFDASCGEEGFIIGLSANKQTAFVQYLTSNGPEEASASVSELEVVKRPSGKIDIPEACSMCGYLHHANNCTICPGEYCKRYHKFEEE